MLISLLAFLYLRAASVRAAFPSAWRMSLIVFVSTGLWKCLLHLTTSPDVEGGTPAGLVPGVPWTSNSGRSHPLCEVARCSWPSVFGVSWLPLFLSRRHSCENCFFCRLLLRSVSFVFCLSGFHPHGSMCDSVLPFLFGVCMALGLTPQVVLWLHSLLSLWSSSY